MAKKKIETQTIVWKETVTIENTPEKTQELQAAFDSSKEVLLDISELTDIDITGIQLLIAAQKEATLRKNTFKIIGHIPPSVMECFQSIGIPVDKVAGGEQFSSNILETISSGEHNA